MLKLSNQNFFQNQSLPDSFWFRVVKKTTPLKAVTRSKLQNRATDELGCYKNQILSPNMENFKVLIIRGVVLGAMVC